MTYSVVITPEAEADLIEAFRWYEAQRRGLGSAFLDSIETGLSQIKENPLISPQVRGIVRRHLVRRFPYGIFYTAEGGQVSVVSIFHVRRDPKKWTD